MSGAESESYASDEELLEVRGLVAFQIGATMRAWNRGMVAARRPEDEALYAEIAANVTPSKPPSADDFDEFGRPILKRLTDEEYLRVVPGLVRQIERIRQAYERGMIVAETPEQEAVMAKLRRLYGPEPEPEP
jgi:hypothetical protein